MKPRPPLPRQHHRQRGAAVILALLTVALVAGIAAATVGDLGVAMDQVQGRHDQAQARQLARGAVDWARNVLADDRRNNAEVDHLGEAWATRIPPTPVEEGEVSGELQDMSGRFNLNSLTNGLSGSKLVAGDTFLRLLNQAGIGQQDALALRNALIDWLDADSTPSLPGGAEIDWYAAQQPPRRPANGPLVAVSELLQIRGFTPALVARLSPFVAALPDANSAINANTAPPEVLAAAVEGLSLDTARVLAAERNRIWYKNTNEFKARLQDRNIESSVEGFDVRSRYFLATGRAQYGVSMVRMEVLLDRPTGQGSAWPVIVWQKLL